MKDHLYHQVCGFHVGDFPAGTYKQCCFCEPLETCVFDDRIERAAEKMREQEANAPKKNPEDKVDLKFLEKEMRGL